MDCIGRTWIFLSHWDCIVIPWGHLWLLARRTGLTVSSLLCVYVLQREGMSGALTCIWCAKMYLCLSYLPLLYLFWKGKNTLSSSTFIWTNPVKSSVGKGRLFGHQTFYLFTNQREGSMIILTLSTGLFYEAVVNKTIHSLNMHSFWKLKAEEPMSGQASAHTWARWVDARWPQHLGTKGAEIKEEFEAKCRSLPASISPHPPCPFWYLLLCFCLTSFVPGALLPAGGTPQTPLQTTAPPWLQQAALPAATAALARTQLAGNEEQRQEEQPEISLCHGNSWQKGGRNARKRRTDVWGCSWGLVSTSGELYATWLLEWLWSNMDRQWFISFLVPVKGRGGYSVKPTMAAVERLPWAWPGKGWVRECCHYGLYWPCIWIFPKYQPRSQTVLWSWPSENSEWCS